MSSTKYIIAEQVMMQLAGGYPDIAASTQREDIYKRIEQKINSEFKLQQFAQNLPSGETIPDNLSIATYEDEDVDSLGNGKSSVDIPVTPVSLPKNMGVYLVYSSKYPDIVFIPMQRGQLSLLRADTLLNDLMGQIGYEVKNDKLLFTKDLTALDITKVNMELVVFDISQYSETTPLPIPADFEDKLVAELFKEFSMVQPENGMVNQFTEATSKTIQ